MAKRHFHPAHQSQTRTFQETEVYLMCLILYVFFSKFGISDKTQTRRAQVDKGIAGPVWVVTSADAIFGWYAEGFVHTLYFLFNVRRWFPWAFKKSTGGTEIFFNVNPICGMLFLYTCHAYGFRPENWMIALAFFFPFIWLDGWIWVQVFRGFSWLFAAGMLYMSWWFFTNA